MGRPRAGHSWSGVRVNGHWLALIQDAQGLWRTTGEASKWPRCTRCRRPTDARPFGGELCDICYFYKSGLLTEEFWRLHKTGYPFAPYNIGKACQHADRWGVLSRINANPAKWRAILRAQHDERTHYARTDGGESGT